MAQWEMKKRSSNELMSMAFPKHVIFFEAVVVVVVVVVAVAVVVKEIPCFAQAFSFKPRIQYSATGHASAKPKYYKKKLIQ